MINERAESRWLKNNQQIMTVAETAKDWVPEAQKYMGKHEFRLQFLAISDELTHLIKDSSVSHFHKTI